MSSTRMSDEKAVPGSFTAWNVSLIGRFLDALLAAYEEESVRYVVLRNYERWPDDFGSDVDCVIDRGQLALNESIIRRLAPRFGLRWRVSHKRSTHVTYYLLPERFEMGESGISLDFRVDVVHRGFVYLPGDLVLDSARRVGNVKVPSPALESLAILLHCVLDKQGIRESYRRRLAELGTGNRREFVATAQKLVGERLAGALLRAIESATVDDALALRRRLFVACALRNPQAPARWLRTELGIAWDRLGRLLRPPGVLVVFLGPDGSGKSAVAESLRQRFAATRVPVSLVYLGAREALLPTRRLSRTARAWLAGPKRRRIAKDVNRRVRLSGLLHITADKTLRYWTHVRPRLMRNGIVLLDRYFYDFRSFPHPAVEWPAVSAIAMRIIPKPKLVFCMHGDPAVIAARKNELTAAETARHISCYEKLGPWLPNLQMVPAVGEIDTVVDGLAKQILRLYAAEH